MNDTWERQRSMSIYKFKETCTATYDVWVHANTEAEAREKLDQFNKLLPELNCNGWAEGCETLLKDVSTGEDVEPEYKDHKVLSVEKCE